MTPPFHRSYWAVPHKLLAGCYPGDLNPARQAAKLQSLVDARVCLVLNLMEETERDHAGHLFNDYSGELRSLAAAVGSDIRIERFPIRDRSVPTYSHMRRILDALKGGLANEGAVFVHCWGGKGRTATVVGCHLLEVSQRTSHEIIDLLKVKTAHAREHFWPTPQTTEQCDFIHNWRQTHA